DPDRAVGRGRDAQVLVRALEERDGEPQQDREDDDDGEQLENGDALPPAGGTEGGDPSSRYSGCGIRNSAILNCCCCEGRRTSPAFRPARSCGAGSGRRRRTSWWRDSARGRS